MTKRVDPNLLYELVEYGALSAEKCTNCGNCTAICSMTTSEDDRFPRGIIRSIQLGLKDELLGSKELWMCFNCGQCSDTCPQQAEPANLMAAARIYAISSYSPFGIGRLFSKRPLVGGIITVLLVLLFGLFLYSEGQVMSPDSLKLFGFLSRDLIHNAGIVAMVVFVLISMSTIFMMISRISKTNQLSFESLFKKGAKMNTLHALWEAVVVQSLAQKRYREECDKSEEGKHWFLSKWFVHAATMWGFLGLLSATALDFLLDVIGVKATGTFVPLWYPTRLIGTLSGLLFMYGVSILLYQRIWSVDKSHSFSHVSDWIFLILLWFSGLTGFIIEIALYLPGAPLWGYWLFLFHVSVSIVLLLLIPFTKFAHAIYRIIALYIQALGPIPQQKTVSEEAGVRV